MLNPSQTARNQQVIERYTDQPVLLPRDLRDRIEAAFGGSAVELYAIADIDASLRLAETWLCLGRTHVAVVRAGKEGDEPHVSTFERSAVTKLRETPGLSCTTLTILGDPDEPPLAVLRFTYRQQAAMGAIQFVLQQQIDGKEIHNAEADAFYADSMAEPVRKAQASVVKNRMAVVTRLLTYLKPYKWRFAAGVLAAAALTAISLVPPFLTKILIDDVITPYAQGGDLLTFEAAKNTAMWLLAAIVGVYLLRNVFLYVRLVTLSIVGEYVARDLRSNLYDHLHKLSVSYFSRNQTGSLISRVGSDTDRIWDFIAFGVAELLLSALMIIGLAVVLVLLDWQLGLILILPVPLIFLAIIMMGKALHKRFLRIWHQWSQMTAVLSDTIPGMRVVKAFDQGDHERERFNRRSGNVMNEAIKVTHVWATRWPLIFLALEFMTILVWFFAVPRMLGDGTPNSATLTTGGFIAFLLYMGMFLGPIESFGFLTRMINRSLSSAYRVFEVLDTEPEVLEKDDSVRLDPVNGQIRFEDVTFGYDPVRQIIKGVTFEINPGEMIGLVGPSGAGKTTLTNLIARFYDVNTGVVRIDGHDIRDLEVGNYRRQIGIVMQDPYLFHGSIVDNIRYGMPEATIEEVIAAAVAANAHDFICRLANGYDTIVGERGHTLSGGERQRVSIARAILHNPRILILDEATSSVDTETERKIQEAIERLVAGRTVIAIAHRLSTLRRATRLIVLKDGRIHEMGTHEELIDKEDGLYRKLQSMQRELHEMYAV